MHLKHSSIFLLCGINFLQFHPLVVLAESNVNKTLIFPCKERAEIVCPIVSQDTPVSWFKDDQPIVEAQDSSILVLDPFEAADVGLYTCDNGTSITTSFYVYASGCPELIVPSEESGDISLSLGQQGVVPCKPTEPNVTMNLARCTQKTNILHNGLIL